MVAESKSMSLLHGGIVRDTDCVHYIDKKYNMAESFFWMGVCGILVMTFSLPEQLRLGLRSAKARHIETLAYDKMKPPSSSKKATRMGLDAIVAGAYLFLGYSLVQRELSRSTLLLLVQSPFCLICAQLAIMLAQYSTSHRLHAMSIVSAILLLPSVPAGVINLALANPSDGHSYNAATLLFFLLAPFYTLSANRFGAVRVFHNSSNLLQLGVWYTMQIKWTIFLGLAVYSHGNLEYMLCPPDSLRRLVSFISPELARTSSLPLYRSVLTIITYLAGSAYSLGAMLAANTLMVRNTEQIPPALKKY